MSNGLNGLLLCGCVALAACTSSIGAVVQVTTQASGSPYFSLSRPNFYKVGDQIVLSGRVCRRARTTLLSPYGVRLEHITAAGVVLETARAGVGPIYGRADQACARYAARVVWTLNEGDTVNACFERGGPCPVIPSAKRLFQKSV